MMEEETIPGEPESEHQGRETLGQLTISNGETLPRCVGGGV